MVRGAGCVNSYLSALSQLAMLCSWVACCSAQPLSTQYRRHVAINKARPLFALLQSSRCQSWKESWGLILLRERCRGDHGVRCNAQEKNRNNTRKTNKGMISGDDSAPSPAQIRAADGNLNLRCWSSGALDGHLENRQTVLQQALFCVLHLLHQTDRP